MSDQERIKTTIARMGAPTQDFSAALEFPPPTTPTDVVPLAVLLAAVLAVVPPLSVVLLEVVPPPPPLTVVVTVVPPPPPLAVVPLAVVPSPAPEVEVEVLVEELVDVDVVVQAKSQGIASRAPEVKT